MSAIYSRATRVRIWLGLGTDESSHIVSVLTKTRKNRDAYSYSDCCEAVKKFGEQPYWRRMWVLQEIFVASKLELRWGSDKVPQLDSCLDHMTSKLKFMTRKLLVLDRWQQLRQPRRGWIETPAEAIFTFDDCYCSDLRDHVYAIMGMVNPQERIVVDYGKTPMEVFLDCGNMVRRSISYRYEYRSTEAHVLMDLSERMGLDIVDHSSHQHWPVWKVGQKPSFEPRPYVYLKSQRINKHGLKLKEALSLASEKSRWTMKGRQNDRDTARLRQT